MGALSDSVDERKAPSKLPELWHYTTLEGAIGILKNGVIWATDSRFLNDPEEYQHALSVAREFVNRELPEDEFKREVLQWLMHLAPFDSDNAPPLIASFSEASDDLTQWRSYSSEGTGVALVFDGGELNASVASCDGVLQRCTYVDLANTVSWPSDLRVSVGEILRELREQWDVYDSANSEDVGDRNCGIRDTFRSGGRFEQLKLTLKPQAFSVEREWRAVFRGRGEGIDLRVSRGRIVPFRKIALRENGAFPRRIVLGPGAKDGLTRTALEEFCWSVGLNAEIAHSSHRLRT